MNNKQSPYDLARQSILFRNDTINSDTIAIESGVNFFMLALEKLGAKVLFTCEGHPTGFNIVFEADYDTTHELSLCGYFTYQLMANKNRWSMNLRGIEAGITFEKGSFSTDERDRVLRNASRAWAEKGYTGKNIDLLARDP